MGDFQERLSSTSLQVALAQHPFVSGIIFQACLGSTNDVAKERAREGAPEGLLVVADKQTVGRGRLGRRWWAPAGSALLTSLLFRPALPDRPIGEEHEGGNAVDPHRVQQLVMLCALAAADAIKRLTTLSADLKWPNDLIIGDHKLGGLLAESVFVGDRLDSVVVGLGLNVNTGLDNAPSFIMPATSLRLELGHPVARLPLLVSYLNEVTRRYIRFKDGVGPYHEWSERLVTLGRRVTAHLGGQMMSNERSQEDASFQELSGIAEGVDVDGALLLRADDGTLHRLLAADITLQNHSLSRPSSLAQES